MTRCPPLTNNVWPSCFQKNCGPNRNQHWKICILNTHLLPKRLAKSDSWTPGQAPFAHWIPQLSRSPILRGLHRPITKFKKMCKHIIRFKMKSVSISVCSCIIGLASWLEKPEKWGRKPNWNCCIPIFPTLHILTANFVALHHKNTKVFLNTLVTSYFWLRITLANPLTKQRMNTMQHAVFPAKQYFASSYQTKIKNTAQYRCYLRKSNNSLPKTPLFTMRLPQAVLAAIYVGIFADLHIKDLCVWSCFTCKSPKTLLVTQT